MNPTIGIIGGSGLYDMAELTEREEVHITTPFGDPSGPYVLATLRGKLAEWALLQDEGYNSVPGKPKEPVNEVAEAVIEALVGLGYRRPEAKAKVDAALERTPGVTDEQVLIREVFRAERAR